MQRKSIFIFLLSLFVNNCFLQSANVGSRPDSINSINYLRLADKALKASKNKDGIKKQVHKMKSPLGMVASSDLMTYLNQLQQPEVLDKAKQRNQLIDKVIEQTQIIEKEIARRLSNS